MWGAGLKQASGWNFLRTNPAVSAAVCSLGYRELCSLRHNQATRWVDAGPRLGTHGTEYAEANRRGIRSMFSEPRFSVGFVRPDMSARPNALMKGVVGVQLLSGSPLPTRPYWASLLFIGKVIVSHYGLTALSLCE